MSLANIIDSAIAVLSPSAALKRREARSRLELSTLHRGAEHNRLLADWVLGKSAHTPDAWELSTLRERSRDLNRNDPIACGATETLSINIVGNGLSPQSKIKSDTISGLTETKAAELQRSAEAIWSKWTPLADSANRLSFDEIQFLAIRKIIEDGEIFVIPTWANEPWRPLGRVLEMAESERCTSDQMDYEQGIKLGNRGQPVSYSFTVPTTDFREKHRIIAARDNSGRPQVLHVYKSGRIGQLRGVPFFAPAMSYFKHMADYLEAEVVKARVAACLGVFITSADPMGFAAANSSGTDANGARLQAIEPGLVHYLKAGESINVMDPSANSDAFAPFVEGVMRLIGVSLGLPYELLLKDFSKTNYSSARAALLEGRRNFTNWRTWLSKKLCQPVYDLVLEEAYLKGLFDAPDFYKYRAEYCKCSWIGGAWGWVDPVKEVEASKLAMDYGLSTLAEEAAGQGRDWEEILEQKAREKQRAEALGLNLSQGQNAGAAAPGKETKKETENDEKETNPETD